jgi:hypothetical protein
LLPSFGDHVANVVADSSRPRDAGAEATEALNLLNFEDDRYLAAKDSVVRRIRRANRDWLAVETTLGAERLE